MNRSLAFKEREESLAVDTEEEEEKEEEIACCSKGHN